MARRSRRGWSQLGYAADTAECERAAREPNATVSAACRLELRPPPVPLRHPAAPATIEFAKLDVNNRSGRGLSQR